jgi:hypothetical protein
MTDIYLNPATNDIDLTNNTMRLTANNGELIRQKILITLQTFRGEWAANTQFGVPWMKNKNNSIQLLGPSDKDTVDSYVKAAVEGVDGVNDFITYYSTRDRQTREMDITFLVDTDEGEITIDNFSL